MINARIMANNVKKELLLLNFLKYGDISGRKRFQKLMYLGKYKFNIEAPFIFVKYYYGPYSREMQEVLDNLVNFNLIEEKKVKGNNCILYKYSLTRKGKISLNLFSISKNEDLKIKELVRNYKHSPTEVIVREVYEYAGIK